MPFSLPQRSFVYAFLLHYPNDVFSMNNWLIHCITRKIKSEDILNGSNLLVCAKKKENDALFMQLLLMHGLWRSNHFENLEMLSPQSEVKINYPEVNEMVPENWIAIFHAIRAHSKKSAYDMYRSLFCLVCTHLAHFGCKAGFFFFSCCVVIFLIWRYFLVSYCYIIVGITWALCFDIFPGTCKNAKQSLWSDLFSRCCRLS